MKTNEMGRSMVEMLGVLAIIGVLSVAGIAGYTQAMRKNRVNAAIADISMCVILAKTANGGEGVANTSCGGVSFDPRSQLANTTELALQAADANGIAVYQVTPAFDANATITCANIQDLAPSAANTPAARKAGYFVNCP